MSTANSAESATTSKADNTVADWPLKFVRHNFSAHCYDAIGCTVKYAGFTHGADSDDEVSPPRESFGADYQERWSGGHIGLRNSQSPAIVSWRSKDGAPHHAEVDIATIFKDQLILHHVSRDDIPEGISIGDPDIVLEVNDRTISVYMSAHIPTKNLQVPGNRYSDFRKDWILAWSHTY